ncbi:helix-turn-helix transcriptional regulator [Micromonospora sp. WMMD975]|uniref:helix-turn-helix domain-containing protein n=1 Tax=Micromonospora sp. WMMD975 TaxID=3016087 RepID=UPI00249A733C|nr:helix-turn-helix transcriptional regulator [Micromonospora sp. WMMD975]WFE35094.1 helix-turn-helix transcriptional regulator [Micromonospora sp. WMMD975]
MTVPRNDGRESPSDTADRFGERLRRLRTTAGLSLSGLARKVNYSRGYLSKVETGRAPGNVPLAERCDEALGTGGVLARLAREQREGRYPSERSEPRGPREDISIEGPRQRGRDVAASQRDPDDQGGQAVLPLSSAAAVAFMLAVDEAHNGLRAVARTDLPPLARRGPANDALHDARVYALRERLLVLGAAPLVTAAEAAFLRLIAVRDVIRAGARLEEAAYHQAYHPFAEALWAFRMALRVDLGQPPFTPDALGRQDWSDRERCRDCGD